MGVTARLGELGIELPVRVPAAPDHTAIVRTGNLVFVSGHGPLDANRRPVFKGRVGDELTEAEGYDAARLSALNTLATLQEELRDLDDVLRLVRLTGYVNSPPGFERHPWVINGASELFDAVFGEKHARATLGATGLPLGMACVIETLFEVR
jgi:enamine deaminase RidA (YjgF/YER057c/UK114 family)